MSLGSSIMKREDDASRGLDASKNISSSNWFKGSEFFWHNETSLTVARIEVITDVDSEVKHLVAVNRIAESNGRMLPYLMQIIAD